MERAVRFTDGDVEEWCESNRSPVNIGQISFDERVVPGMMLLDQLQAMLPSLGDEDEEVILAGVTAARFRDPVLIDETVTFTLDNFNEGANFDTVDFEARVDNRDSLVANGVLTVVING